MFTRRIGTAAAALALLALAPGAAEAKDGKGKSRDGASKACQALKAELGAAAFTDAHGSLGRCVSQAREDVREAAADCREQRDDLGAEAFAEEWADAPAATAARAQPGKGKGKGKSKKRKRGKRHGAAQVDPAFARCVAETVRDIADERAAAAEDEAADGEDVDEGEPADADEAGDDHGTFADDEDEDEDGRGPKHDRGSDDD
jgi:hypothetical protein